VTVGQQGSLGFCLGMTDQLNRERERRPAAVTPPSRRMYSSSN
jgi:hypothetical protein